MAADEPERTVSEADDLYRLDPGRFVAARNTLARDLRSAGDKEGAARVAGLRRPTAPAWALNQVARSEPALIETVMGAADAVRVATERALEGDAAGMRSASATLRAAIDAAVTAANDRLGPAASDAAKRRLGETLRAAAADPVIAERLRHGILEGESTAPGFDSLAGTIGPPAPPPGGVGVAERDGAGAPRTAGDARAASGRGRVAATQAGERVAATEAGERAAATEAGQQARRARGAATESEERAGQAAAAAAEMEGRARRARAAAAEVEERARQAAAAATEAEERARRARTAATEAAEQAQQALEAANEAENRAAGLRPRAADR